MPQILEIPFYFQLSALHKAEIFFYSLNYCGQSQRQGSNFNQTHIVEAVGFYFLSFFMCGVFRIYQFSWNGCKLDRYSSDAGISNP